MKKIIQNLLAILLILIVVGGITGLEIYRYSARYNYKWTISTPEQMAMNATMLTNMQYHFENDSKYVIRSLLIIKNDSIVFEYYDDCVVCGPDETQSLKAATWSIVSLLIGIAIDKGYLCLNDYILDFFPEYTFANMDTNKSAMQVRHFLTMTSGLIWDDSIIDPLHPAKTDFKVCLDGEMVAAPGEKFALHTGLVTTLIHILERAVGYSAYDFAKKYLFDPLDYEEHEWYEDEYGVIHPYNLELKARDMAKFGMLILHQGVFNGRRLVSSEWVMESTSVHTNLSIPQWGYEFGYIWWNWELAGTSGFSAQGIYDQLIMVVPEYCMVIVAQCNHPLLWNFRDQYTQELVEDYILPAVFT